MIDLKKFIKLNRLTIAICLLCLLLLIVPFTYSRFHSNVSPKVNIGTAFYVLKAEHQTETIKLDDLIPSATAYTYEFSVANDDGTNRCEVDMEYEVVITTTTNLPLTISLGYLNDQTNIIESDEIIQDEDGMYLRQIKTNKVFFSHTNSSEKNYKLSVVFPSQYTDTMYQNIIEGLIISVNSEQVVEEPNA